MRLFRCYGIWSRGQDQVNSQQQVMSARASLLAFSPIANQPHHFSDSRKMVKNVKCAFCSLWHSVARDKQQEKRTLASWVCQS